MDRTLLESGSGGGGGGGSPSAPLLQKLTLLQSSVQCAC